MFYARLYEKLCKTQRGEKLEFFARPVIDMGSDQPEKANQRNLVTLDSFKDSFLPPRVDIGNVRSLPFREVLDFCKDFGIAPQKVTY
jgi:hypothetical protein